LSDETRHFWDVGYQWPVTTLGLSIWTEKGAGYRTIQPYFHSAILNDRNGRKYLGII
jgi:hypothetical protein